MRRGDAVAGIAHRIVNVAGPDPAERREVCWRNVDGPAPRILDGHLGEAREREAEALGRLADGARVTRERVIDRPPRPPATSAEGDAAVARGPKVAQRCAEVADEP